MVFTTFMFIIVLQYTTMTNINHIIEAFTEIDQVFNKAGITPAKINQLVVKHNKVFPVVDKVGKLRFTEDFERFDLIEEMRDNDHGWCDFWVTDGIVDIEVNLKFSKDREYSTFTDERGNFEYKETFEILDTRLDAYKDGENVSLPDSAYDQVDEFINKIINDYAL